MSRRKTLCTVVLALAIMPGVADHVASGGEVESGIHWPKKTAGIQFFSVVRTAHDTVVSVGERGTVATLTARGDSADEVELNVATVGSSALTSVCAWPNGALVMTSQDGMIWRRERDTAGAWAPADTSMEKDTALDGEPLFNCWCGADGVGLAVGAFGTIFRTDDYGRKWSPISVSDDEDYHLYDIYHGHEDVVIVGEAGRIYRSGDLGKTWVRDVTPYNGSLFNAVVSVDGDALAFGLRGTVLARSAEAGDWRLLRAPGRSEAYFAATQTADGVLLGGATGNIDRIRNETIEKVFEISGRPSVMDIAEAHGVFVIATTVGLAVLKL